MNKDIVNDKVKETNYTFKLSRTQKTCSKHLFGKIPKYSVALKDVITWLKIS